MQEFKEKFSEIFKKSNYPTDTLRVRGRGGENNLKRKIGPVCVCVCVCVCMCVPEGTMK